MGSRWSIRSGITRAFFAWSFALCFGFASCVSEKPAAVGPMLVNSRGLDGTFSIDDIRIEIDRGLSYWAVLGAMTYVGGAFPLGDTAGSEPGFHVNNKLIEIRAGEVLIGGHSFGRVKANGLVRIAQGGVFVDGAKRGELP